MSKITEQFKQEIASVCERYGAKMLTAEQYDQNEQVCGDVYWIVVDGEYLDLNDLIPSD